MSAELSTHTLSVLVENKPGVLARVSSLISRRGYNIESLAVGPTEYPTMSRITLAVTVDDEVLEQITKQLNKLIEVLKIVELEGDAVRRELILVKVRATAETRGQLIEVIGLFGGKVVDVTADILTIEAVGKPEKLAEAMGCVGLRAEDPNDVDAVIDKALSINDAPVVVEFVVHKDAMVWPMVAAGTSNDEIKVARDMAPLWDGETL